MQQRIQKVLAHAGVASRRACEELVLQGRVQVNGKTVRQLPVLVDPAVDDIVLDGQRIAGPSKGRPRSRDARAPHAASPEGEQHRHAYIMLNKPAGVYSTNVSQTTAGRPQTRAIDLLHPDFRRRVYPVGRLDASSRGLLLLTDDGDLTHKLTHPSFGVPKTYKVICDGEVTPRTIQQLQQGVWLAEPGKGGSKTSPAHIKIVRRTRDKSTLEITIKEGRNRQVRRMLAKLGHKVRDLVRTRLGPLKLGTLPEAASRPLTQREIADLQAATSPTRPATKPSPATKPRQTAKPREASRGPRPAEV